MNRKMKREAERLFAGSKVGNLHEVQEAVKSGASVNLVNDWDESTPLSWAALGGHTDVVRFLLEQGADPGSGNSDSVEIQNIGKIVESLANSVVDSILNATQQRASGQEEIAADLGADKAIEVQPLATLPDPPAADGEYDEDPDDDSDDEGPPETALCAAARGGHIDIMELLVAHGAPILHNDSLRELPMAAAALGGHLPACRWLLDNGASYTANDVCSPIHSAAESGNADIVKLFLDLGVDPNLPEAEDGYIPLHDVTSVEAAKLLVQAGAGAMVDHLVQGDSPMSSAGESGNLSVVEYLASISQNQAAIDRAREQLKIANGVANKHTCAMIQASWSCNVTRFQQCLSRPGVDVNGYDDSEQTALLLACSHKRPQIIGLLLRANADPSTKGSGTDSDNSPLSELCSNLDEAHPTIVISIAAALLDAGADISVRQVDGSSILHWALLCPPLVKLALERGADATVRNNEGMTPADQVAHYLDAQDGGIDVAHEESSEDLGGFLQSIDQFARSQMALYRMSQSILSKEEN